MNIFGGIMKYDVIANGIVSAALHWASVPLVVRLEGTNVEEGKKILRNLAWISLLREALTMQRKERGTFIGRCGFL